MSALLGGLDGQTELVGDPGLLWEDCWEDC